MSPDPEKAKALLKSGGYTLVLCAGDQVRTSTERGVKPLLALINGRVDCTGFFAADRVVGKAAAFLYVILGVKAVYAEVISAPAERVLAENGISVEYGCLTKAIRNRAGTGFCPMETAVKDIDEPYAALEAVRRKAAELNA